MQDYYTPKGKHLTLTERRMIKLLEGQSNREIARRLAKAPQTIHNEVKRGQVRQQVRQGKYEQVYSADFAQKAYQNNIALKRLVRQRNKALSFGTIQNNIALKRQNARRLEEHGFGTIQNNIALKHLKALDLVASRFGTIQNNIALKRAGYVYIISNSFGTIQNNIALKHKVEIDVNSDGFGTIQNNIALKLRAILVSSRGVLGPFKTT